MAERVDELPPVPKSPGRPAMYPWHDWLDGSVWKLKRGEDFAVEVRSFMSAANTAARNRGQGLSRRIQGDVVFIQARDANVSPLRKVA
jgi:hypothetical protein